MNVWEDGQDKVAKFVKEKGDGMTYPVAYVGRGGTFEKTWLKPAGVRGIPHTFLVKDGKLLLGTHPASITDETIAALLEGGEAQDKFVQQVQEQQHKQQELTGVMQAFSKAVRSGDSQGISGAIKELEKINPKSPYLDMMKVEQAIVGKNWDQAAQLTTELSKSPVFRQFLGSLAQRAVSPSAPATAMQPARNEAPFPESFRKAIADQFGKSLTGDASDARSLVILAVLRWDLGEKDAALAAGKKALENRGKLPAEPFEDFVKSIEDGKPQTPSQVFMAVSKAMSKKPATPVPATPANE